MTGSNERKGLGRGLSALMAEVNLDPNQTRDAPRRSTTSLPVERLVPNPEQPRRDFHQGALEDLAASIREKGVIQPLIVRPRADGTYEIVAGERRWRAAQMAQLHDVPVLVREFTDTEVLEIALIENIQRADLNSLEEALAYRQLMDRFGHTQDKLADALSKSRSHIANCLRLLNLPDFVQSLVRDGTLTAGHARALVPASDPSALARIVVDRGLSVRQTEDLARNDQKKSPVQRPRGGRAQKDADTLALEGDVSANLGMVVQIRHEPGTNEGTVTIRYKSLEDLDLLCRGLSLIPRDGSV